MVFSRFLGISMAGISFAFAAPVAMIAKTGDGKKLDQTPTQVKGKPIKVWTSSEKTGSLVYQGSRRVQIPAEGTLYVNVSYLDHGYGDVNVHLNDKAGRTMRPDRYLGLARTNSGEIVTARMRFPGVSRDGDGEVTVKVDFENPGTIPPGVQGVSIQDEPFDDPNFKFVLSNPWEGAYKGPTVKAANNTTLKGKAMTGYQGWFRTPNDPEGRGWSHWGNIEGGTFSIDMWPDVSQYPAASLEKAADLKLKSGRQAYLFSSAWPSVVDTHFRWMRENDIDGAFLQRFVNDGFNSISGRPEWVLSNVRAAANKEGRIWAVEYDVSGYSDAKLLETLTTDWKWFVDKFKLLEDPNYAREGGKPVVFIWGLPFPNRNYSTGTANAVVDFFKNDPKYGGNYVIGGIPGNWREMDPGWKDHFKKYDSVLSWMSQSYAEDLADFKAMGLTYYSHVMPGFSWANLKHLPTGDDTLEYTPRAAGKFYWDQLAKSAKAGCDRLFVGMFDEYDEATAVMPMSDDSPETPSRPGVAATFYKGDSPQEHGTLARLPRAEVDLGSAPAGGRIPADHFYVRMGGSLVFPADGSYTLSIEGAPGDDAELTVRGKKILRAPNLTGIASTTVPITAKAGESIPYRIDYRHKTGSGTLRLLWASAAIERQPVPETALKDAWGRFITNEGKPGDWWLKLTNKGKAMMNGKHDADSPMP